MLSRGKCTGFPLEFVVLGLWAKPVWSEQLVGTVGQAWCRLNVEVMDKFSHQRPSFHLYNPSTVEALLLVRLCVAISVIKQE